MVAVKGRLLRVFGTSVIAQAMLSGSSMLIGLLLIRYTSDHDYGLYILVTTTVTMFVTAQGSWLSGPVQILASKRDPDARRHMIGAVEGWQRRAFDRLALLALPIPVICWLAGWWTPVQAMVATLGVPVVMFSMLRDFHRSVLQSYARATDMFRTDLLFVVVLVAATVVAAFGPLPAILVVIGGLLLANWSSSQYAHRQIGRDPGWVDAPIGDYLVQMRSIAFWSVVGALIYWVYTQSYNYLLAARLDLSAVADVNAARLLVMPGMVMVTGVRTLLLPMASRWIADHGFAKVVERLLLILAGMLPLMLGYLAVIWWFRDWVVSEVMRKQIRDLDVLLLMWGVILLQALVRELMQNALFARESLRGMAFNTALSALVSLAVVWYGLDRWGARAVVIGQAAGEMSGLLGLGWMILRNLRQAPPAAAGSAA